MKTKSLTWTKRVFFLGAKHPANALLDKTNLESITATLADNIEEPEAAENLRAVELEIPDLSEFKNPRQRAEFLLHTAAEIEHALLVQYLYAAFSLAESPFAGTAPADAALLVNKWRSHLLETAREEMGHLITVQNLLRLIGGAFNFEREDFPFRRDYYPFPFTLEPLSRVSLAKYITAEMPVFPEPPPSPFENIPEIVRIATENVGMTVNRVGVLYALLIAIFSRPEEVNAPASDAMSEWVSFIHEAANTVFEKKDQHLKDKDFLPDTATRQAQPDDWGGDSGVFVRVAADRQQAIDALKEIALQGEGPPPEEMSFFSHFGRFFLAFGEFPANEEWIPTRRVAKNPSLPKPGVPVNPDTITNPRSQAWAELLNLRYAMLLFSLAHFMESEGPLYIETGAEKGDRTPRGFLQLWAFDEMRRIGKIGIKLSRLPRFEDVSNPARAGAPFALPPSLALPVGESARWKDQRDRFEQSRALIETMLRSGSADETDGFLQFLLKSDEKNRDLSQTQVSGLPLPPQPREFQKVTHILDDAVRGFFVGEHGAFWRDINLTRFLSVRPAGARLLIVGNSQQSNLVKVLEGTLFSVDRMPLRRPPVPKSRIEFIKEWIDRGCPDSEPQGNPGITSEPNPLRN